jgi:inhibitor of cysteine peptidase
MKQAKHQGLALLLIAAVLATACSPQPTQTPPIDQTPPGSLIHGEAAVEAIEILILESFPVQVHVVARGYLPDGCTEIGEIRQACPEQTFQVTITTVRPAAAVCTQALEPFEEAIALDVLGLQAGVYTVDVNGITGTFELAVDNVMPAEPAP